MGLNLILDKINILIIRGRFMFQTSLLKNFSKSFNAPDESKIIKLVTEKKYIAEDANGAEFIALLSEFCNWTHCSREVKNSTDMKKADGVVYNSNNEPIAIIELKSSDNITIKTMSHINFAFSEYIYLKL